MECGAAFAEGVKQQLVVDSTLELHPNPTDRMTTRDQILGAQRPLPNGYQAELVIAALVRSVKSTLGAMCPSMTRNRCSEIAHWEVLTGGWGLPVFLCDSHAPWQRPKNENSDRQLRFWFPKGTDPRDYSQPRRQYGLQSAGERYAEALACSDR